MGIILDSFLGAFIFFWLKNDENIKQSLGSEGTDYPLVYTQHNILILTEAVQVSVIFFQQPKF